jgi:hypothetical protein
MFKPSAHLEEAIRAQNLVRIYGVLSTILHEDPTFSTGKFMATLNYIKSKNIPQFFKPFIVEKFKEKSDWDKEYWTLMASALIENFCMERIEHLREIGQYLNRDSKPVETEPRQVRTEFVSSTKKVRPITNKSSALPILLVVMAAIVIGWVIIAAMRG